MSLRRDVKDWLVDLWPGIVEVPLRLAAGVLSAVVGRSSSFSRFAGGGRAEGKPPAAVSAREAIGERARRFWRRRPGPDGRRSER
jgi:hypothetical protein